MAYIICKAISRVFGELIVTRGLLIMQRVGSVTPMLFKGQLYFQKFSKDKKNLKCL